MGNLKSNTKKCFCEAILDSDNGLSDTDNHRMHRTLWVTKHEIEATLYVVSLSKDAKVSITAVAVASSFMGFLQQTSQM
jgi:hypothetical protein